MPRLSVIIESSEALLEETHFFWDRVFGSSKSKGAFKNKVTLVVTRRRLVAL